MQKFWIPVSLSCCVLAASANAALQFTSISSGVSQTLTSAAGDNNGTFIAAGFGSRVLRVTFNGSALVLTPVSTPITSQLRSAVYSPSGFLVGGTNAALFTSPNGQTWT